MEPTAAFVGSGLLGLVAAGSLVLASAHGRKSGAMADTPTTPAGRVHQEGYFEVKGRAVCDHPLTAPGTGDPCVWFHHVIRERRETERVDHRGRSHYVRRWHTLVDDQQFCPFHVEDGSGRLAIFPGGASVEGHARVEEQGDVGLSMHFGREERLSVVRVDDEVYALGPVARRPDGPTMEQAADPSRPFVLSVRSEEELQAGHQRSFLAALAVAFLCGGGSLLLLLIGLGGS